MSVCAANSLLLFNLRQTTKSGICSPSPIQMKSPDLPRL